MVLESLRGNPYPALQSNPIFLPCFKATQGFGSLSSQVIGINNADMTAFYTGRPITLTQFHFLASVIGGVGSFYRVGIYKSISQTAPAPDGAELLWDSGNLPADDATLAKNIAIPNIRVMGWFFTVIHTNDGAFAVNRPTSSLFISPAGAERLNGAQFNQAFGALPATCPATTNTGTASLVSNLRFV